MRQPGLPLLLCAPADAQRIGFSHSAKTLVSMHEWVQRPELGERPLVFVVGAFAHGKIDDSYVDEYISISQVRAPPGAGADRLACRSPFPLGALSWQAACGAGPGPAL